MTATFDHAWIAAHIPHHGSMCLLDSVLAHDDQQVRCIARSHRSPANPLRAHGRLAAACGIEYAAQAMAVHGALLAAGAEPRPGFLASVRSAVLHVGRLDDIEDDLLVEAMRVTGDSGTVLYDFTLRAGERLLLEGRAAIVLDVAMPDLPGAQS
ncbi:MAG: putative beta-hydroxyacyl-acyl carrier protein (ACP)-dehydratase [Burkholderia sp.]|nr:putative beta-hydroxyacyl-acyl carrier protein (ACP)-dehydratase [Burkholderia sp.]